MFTSGEKDKLSTLGIGKNAKIKVWLDNNKVEYRSDEGQLIVNANVYINENPVNPEGTIELGIINGFFICHNTKLTILSINKVFGSFICINNEKLNGLAGCPEIVEGDFVFYGNGDGTSVQFENEAAVRKLCSVGGNIIFKRPS